MATTEEQQRALDAAAKQYWSTNLRNAGRSLGLVGGQMEPTQPWFGGGGLRQQALQGSSTAATAPAQPATLATVPPNIQTPANQQGLKQYLDANRLQASSPTPSSVESFIPYEDGGSVTMRSPGAQQTAGLPRPGSTFLRGPNGEMAIPDDRRVNTAALAQMGNAPVGVIHGGLSFQGTAQDASRFFSPITTPGTVVQRQYALDPTGISHRNYMAGTGQQQGGLQAPQYLGPESGLGWKTRLGKYRAELDAFTAAQGQQSARDVAEMQAQYGLLGRAYGASRASAQESPSEVALRQAQAINQLAQAQAAGQPKYSYGEEEVRYGFPGLDGTYQTKKVPIRRSVTGEVDRTQVEEILKDNALRSQFISEMALQKGATDLWAKASAEMKEAAYQQWLKSKQQGGAQ